MNSAIEIDHPFQRWFETLGKIPQAHAESVNYEACHALLRALYGPVEKHGKSILLRAPRAGHGKSHLLTRVQHGLSNSHEFIPIQSGYHCHVDAASLLDDAIRCLGRALPASGGLCVLDLIVRQIFSYALQPLVASGEVPCQDREGALAALRSRPVETFDFHHPHAVTAHWAAENFEALGQRLSHEIASRCQRPIGTVAFWVSALFDFANAAPADAARLGNLTQLIQSAKSGDAADMDRLQTLLSMICLIKRVVLVADEVEAFSTDENAAMRFAAFLGSLRQAVPQLDIILSVNQDVWKNAFLPRLSGGLADRLSELVIDLKALQEEEMIALLDSRAPGLGAAVLSHIDLRQSGTHARGLLQAAGVAWLVARTQQEPAPSSEDAVLFAPEAIQEEQPVSTECAIIEEPPCAPEPAVLVDPPDQVASSSSPPAAESPPPSKEDTDRVDELLRQFRERYGRGSL